MGLVKVVGNIEGAGKDIVITVDPVTGYKIQVSSDTYPSPLLTQLGENMGAYPARTLSKVVGVDAIVANLAPGVVPIICAITSARNEPTGSANNLAIVATNAALAAAYGANFLDLFSLICTNNGAPADAYLTTSAGVIAAGEVHLNDYGYSVVAAAVAAKQAALGI